MLVPNGFGSSSRICGGFMQDMDSSLGCPLPVVGVVHSDRIETEHTPVQAGINRAETGTAVIDETYADALVGIEGFDYLWLLTWLHRPRVLDPPPLRQVPFLLRPTQEQVGVFAMRGPRRVNPIGLSLVRLLAVEGRALRFGGVDLIDGTPILDIKPYVAAFDRPEGEVRAGWFDAVQLREGVTPADLTPSGSPHPE